MGAPWRPRGPDDLDEEQRERIRRQVLRTVRDYRPTAGDRVYDVFAVLALPAPHLFRLTVALAVLLAVAGTATVASADALPDAPLYGLKLAGEEVRLALARAPEDRASVELSMAEHRLAEAVRLVEDGRQADALVVTGAYGTHLANAAAELATVERMRLASRPVVEQLQRRLAEQQRQATDIAARFVSDPATNVGAQLFRAIASFAPGLPGETVSEGIAVHAADVAGRLADVAERLAEAAAADAHREQEEAHRATETPVATRASFRVPATPPQAPARPTQPTRTPDRTAARASVAPTLVGEPRLPAAVRSTATAPPTDRAQATLDPKKAADAQTGKAQAAKAVAEKVKQEAEKARAAAEKAKEAAKRTPAPRSSPKR